MASLQRLPWRKGAESLLSTQRSSQSLRIGRQSALPLTWQRSITSQIDIIEASLQKVTNEARDIALVVNSNISTDPIQPPPEPSEAVRDIPAEFHEFLRQRSYQRTLGTTMTDRFQTSTITNNPIRPSDVTLELLLAAEAHLGHNTSIWNPANARYIFGIREHIHIIALEETAAHLRRACKVVSAVAKSGGIILFVGTRRGQQQMVISAARRAGGYHLFQRWKPGSIRNRQQVLGKCQLKAVDEFDREIPGLEDQLKEHTALTPDLVVCLNPLENSMLLHECGLNNIPTIGIIDTNANPTHVTYPIPANDDSLRCSALIIGAMSRAAEEGQQQRRELALQGRLTYKYHHHGLTVPVSTTEVST